MTIAMKPNTTSTARIAFVSLGCSSTACAIIIILCVIIFIIY